MGLGLSPGLQFLVEYLCQDITQINMYEKDMSSRKESYYKETAWNVSEPTLIELLWISASSAPTEKYFWCFWKTASTLVSSPRTFFVRARKCLKLGMKILACPCSSVRENISAAAEWSQLIRTEPAGQVSSTDNHVNLKNINTHLTFHHESMCAMRLRHNL